MDNKNRLLAAALGYAKRGWPVFPLHTIKEGHCTCQNAECAHPGKHPRWHKEDLPNGHLSATTDEKKIRKWWTRWPQANIGIPATEKSGFMVLDIDPRNSGDQSFRRLEGLGSFPLTPRTWTGGGGEHIILQHPKDGNLRELQNFPGIDLKFNGFFVAPPSLHLSGERYAWKIKPDSTPIAKALHLFGRGHIQGT